ncbi:MAG: YdcF family protein [Pseudomonadota bacterium]
MRAFLALALALAAAWSVGLIVFANAAAVGPAQFAQDEPASVAASGEHLGVAVFTGGEARIDVAMALLNSGVGDRLLISGVNPDTSRAQLDNFWGGDASRFDCCVDIGRQAATTVGNALEVRAWADEHDYDRVLLVTSDYHMARAALETRRAMPHATIIPYPVATPVASAPFLQRDWRRIAGEYIKFLAVSASPSNG